MKEEEYHVHSNTLTTMFLVCTRSYTVTSSLATTISPSLDDAQCPWSVSYLHKSKIKNKGRPETGGFVLCYFSSHHK